MFGKNTIWSFKEINKTHYDILKIHHFVFTQALLNCVNFFFKEKATI